MQLLRCLFRRPPSEPASIRLVEHRTQAGSAQAPNPATDLASGPGAAAKVGGGSTTPTATGLERAFGERNLAPSLLAVTALRSIPLKRQAIGDLSYWLGLSFGRDFFRRLGMNPTAGRAAWGDPMGRTHSVVAHEDILTLQQQPPLHGMPQPIAKPATRLSLAASVRWDADHAHYALGRRGFCRL